LADEIWANDLAVSVYSPVILGLGSGSKVVTPLGNLLAPLRESFGSFDGLALGRLVLARHLGCGPVGFSVDPSLFRVVPPLTSCAHALNDGVSDRRQAGRECADTCTDDTYPRRF
jgi:hypothetical protein